MFHVFIFKVFSKYFQSIFKVARGVTAASSVALATLSPFAMSCATCVRFRCASGGPGGVNIPPTPRPSSQTPRTNPALKTLIWKHEGIHTYIWNVHETFLKTRENNHIPGKVLLSIPLSYEGNSYPLHETYTWESILHFIRVRHWNIYLGKYSAFHQGEALFFIDN